MDRTTQALLGLIALGLWANLIAGLVPTAANADSSMIQTYLAAIYNGTCVNHKICG